MICRIDLLPLKAAALCLLLGLSACSEPEPVLAPIERARAALADGDPLQAEVILRDLLATGVDKSSIAAFLGEAELQQGQLPEARRWLGEGDFSEDTRSHGFHMLARLEMEENRLPEAGLALDKALEQEPDSAELWVDIARLRYRGAEQVQAVEASIRAVELDPNNARALRFRAQLVRDSEGMLAALPWFERALEQNPENTDLLYDYAATLGELGQAHQMLSVIREISTINPEDRRIYYLQAVLAARGKNYELAQSLLRRAGQAEQEQPAGLLLSGVIDIENGNYASAAQTLERLASLQPYNKRVGELFARALSLGGKDSELLYHFTDEASEFGSSPYLQTLVGRAYETADDREKAASFLDLAARPLSGKLANIDAGVALDVAENIGSLPGGGARELVRARIASGNAGGAVAAAKPFLNKFPGSVDALLLSGDAALAAKDYRSAIEFYEKVSLIRSPWSNIRKRIVALDGAGRDDEALMLLARYFTSDPANVEATGLLSRVAIENKDWNSAAIFLDHAIKNGGHRDPVLLSLRSRVALELGNAAEAVKLAGQAAEIQPMNREVKRAMALAYRAAGKQAPKLRNLEARLSRLGKP